MEDKNIYQEINLLKSEEVDASMEEWHILDDDVKQVIYNAENTEEKLYKPEMNRYLAKMECPEVVFYVEYSIEDDGYTVHSAYSHRSKIVTEEI